MGWLCNIYRSTTTGGEGATPYATGVSGSPYSDNSVTAGQAYYYKVAAVNGSCVGAQSDEASAASATPTITMGANAAVCAGTTTANLTYSATGNSPDQYSIGFDDAAHTAGFADVTLAALPASPIPITVPGGAAAATYNGTLTVKNSSTGCASTGSAVTVTVSSTIPSSTITAPGGVCASSTGNTASVPSAGAGATYAWTITGGTITSADPQTNGVTFTAGASGTVGLGCTVTSAGGCLSSPGSATVAINSGTLTPYVMSSGDYLETFADIANWKNGFTCGQGANRWGSVAVGGTASVPDPTKIGTSTAAFTSGTSGGAQRGADSIILLATGAGDNTNAVAIDLFLDFTGRDVGTLSFDWAEVNNSTGDRRASLRVYVSTDGSTWTELTGAVVLNLQNNVPASGSISSVALPAALNNSATARIRFYVYNGTGGTTGSRPKIALDNVSVTGCIPLWLTM